MAAITLRYATHTVQQRGGEDEAETAEGSLQVGLADDEIIVDDGEAARRYSFADRRWTILRHADHSMRATSLLAHVHDRESGLASAIHAQDVLRAGGVATGSGCWQAEASYALRWHFGDDASPAAIERSTDDDGWRWCVGELELTRVRPVVDPPALPARGLQRLLSFALDVHPQVASELCGLAALPQTLISDDHMFVFRRQRRFELEAIEPGLDFASMAAGYHTDAPATEVLGQLGKRSGKPPSFRLDDARAALARGALVEAMMAVFAHNWAFVDNTAELVRSIFDRAGWLSPLKRIPALVPPAQSPEAAAKQIRGLERLRRKAGAYAYALDVLIGEKHVERGEQDQAEAAFARALMHDGELAATWVSLGRTYANRLRYLDAWDCFDYADALCPQHAVVRDIHELDTGLRARHPQLF